MGLRGGEGVCNAFVLHWEDEGYATSSERFIKIVMSVNGLLGC
jgi:hypothetical protein